MARNRFFGLTNRVLLLVAALLLVVSYLSMVVNPAKLWLMSLAGLMFVPFLLLNIFLLVWAFMRRSKAFVIPLLAIVPALFFMGRYAHFRGDEEPPLVPQENVLKVLTWNVGRFALFQPSAGLNGFDNCADSVFAYIKEQKPGTIDVYEYSDTGLQVVCEYCGSSQKRGGKESDVYFAFDNPELKMITGGAWEIAIYPHLNVKLKPKDTMYNFFIDFNGELLHGEVIYLESGPFVFLHQKTTPIKDEENDIVYTTTPSERWNHRMCLTKQSDKLSLFIIKCLRENKIFYSTNEVGEVFRNYVMWSDSYSIKN